MTDDEVAAYLEIKAFCDAIEVEQLEAVAAKQSAKTKLAALGLTEQEVQLLLGGN